MSLRCHSLRQTSLPQGPEFGDTMCSTGLCTSGRALTRMPFRPVSIHAGLRGVMVASWGLALGFSGLGTLELHGYVLHASQKAIPTEHGQHEHQLPHQEP